MNCIGLPIYKEADVEMLFFKKKFILCVVFYGNRFAFLWGFLFFWSMRAY